VLISLTKDFKNGSERGLTFPTSPSNGRRIEPSWQKVDFILAKVFIASGRIAQQISLDLGAPCKAALNNTPSSIP
jgi:hypothetical protein